MANISDSVRGEVIATLQRLRGHKLTGDILITAENGQNPTIIALIIEYKRKHPGVDVVNKSPKPFDLWFSDTDLFWFYDQLFHDAKTPDKISTISLSRDQRRELLYTLYRYWSYA